MFKENLALTGMALTLALTGCGPTNPKPESRATVTTIASQSKPEEQLQKIQQEVIRLARSQSVDPLVRNVYLGDLSVYSPIFKSQLYSGLTNSENAQTNFMNLKYSPNPRFSYTLFRDQSVVNYQTLEQMDVSIYFSPYWLNSTDQVKALTMEKEAYHLAMWRRFCLNALATYRAQGRINLIDPTVTEEELANTMGIQLLFENPLVQKLFDYAGYLAEQKKVGQLLQLQDPQINRDLFEYSNSGTIYQMAQERNINTNLEFGSEEFFRMAFDLNGPWGRMIANPSVPSPSLPIER